jgi:cytochrome c
MCKRFSSYGVTFSMLLAVAFAQPSLAEGSGDPDYDANCRACHSLQPDEHLYGPSLANLLGRRVASSDGYVYSRSYSELSEKGIVWSRANIDSFLERPTTFLGQFASPPIENRMPIRVTDQDVRSRIIDFLSKVSDAED